MKMLSVGEKNWSNEKWNFSIVQLVPMFVYLLGWFMHKIIWKRIMHTAHQAFDERSLEYLSMSHLSFWGSSFGLRFAVRM